MTRNTMPPPIVLASTSIYRKELLEKLGLPFIAQTPNFDEEPLKKSQALNPIDLAKALAAGKAKSLSTATNCVIGGDQLVAFAGKTLGKPKTLEKAKEQLMLLNGQTHELITAVHIIYQGQEYPILNVTQMHMRSLTEEQIDSYLQKDNPLDCAGSYKIEKSGLSLFSKIKSTDFSAIQGLPLMAITDCLSKLHYSIPQNPTLNKTTIGEKINTTINVEQVLWQKATQARLNAHAPYSHFLVGAAVEFSDGQIFSGCNVENASYGGTVCAERVAIFNGIAHGAKPPIRKILVVTNQTPPWPPCGFCRQVIAEFATPPIKLAANTNPASTPTTSGISNNLTKVLLAHSENPDTTSFKVFQFQDLLPEGFYPSALSLPASEKD